jgi:exopolysaccharide biosynthesis protein
MTQREVADLMLEFGTDTAMELDGGGSSTMVVDDAPVNRPSDGSGERYVANALLFFWREPEAVPQVGVPVRGE